MDLLLRLQDDDKERVVFLQELPKKLMERLKSLEADRSKMVFTANAVEAVQLIGKELQVVKAHFKLFKTEITKALQEENPSSNAMSSIPRSALTTKPDLPTKLALPTQPALPRCVFSAQSCEGSCSILKPQFSPA